MYIYQTICYNIEKHKNTKEVTEVYIIPEPKKMTIKENSLYAYDINILIDKECGYNIFLAAKELKKVMNEAGCGKNNIVKRIERKGNELFLTFEDKGEQGYNIIVDEAGIIIKGFSERGLFYGIQTMKQIFMQEGVNVPFMEIEDAPDIQDRGYYLDVSRGRVPKVENIKKFVDKLAFYKYSSFQLYIEHSFAWEGFEEIYTNQGYLTAEEILEIDEYCKQRFIELVPSFATFGHLYNLLQSKSYNKYSELKDYQPKVHKWQESREHHTIDASNPESLEIIKEMLQQVIPLFSSNKFNICCDETVDMGKGRGKALAEKIGEGQMYVNFLNNLCGYLKEQGKEVMFWSDVINKHTEFVTQLPQDIICLVWEYNHPMREERYKPVLETSMRKYICPWTAGAVQLIPAYHGDGYVAYENIEDTAALAKKEALEGYLLTDWGDYGHTCHAELRYPILAYGGAKAWNADGSKNVEEFDEHISELEYGNKNALRILKEISKNTVFNWNTLVAEYNKRSVGIALEEAGYNIKEPTKELCENYEALCRLEAKLSGEKMNETRDALLNAVRGTLLITAIKCSEKYPVMENKELAGKLEIWFENFAEVWRKDNKESELKVVYEFIEHYCRKLRDRI